MGEVLVTKDLALVFDGKLGKVNWIKRIGDSTFGMCGMSYYEHGGGKLWIVSFTEGITPVFPWIELTETETIKVIEFLVELRKER